MWAIEYGQWILSGWRPILGWNLLLGEIGTVLSVMGQEAGSKGRRAEPHPVLSHGSQTVVL